MQSVQELTREIMLQVIETLFKLKLSLDMR
jgi:hypothetical protein